VKGFFLSTLPPRPESTESACMAFSPVVRIGSPTPSPARECCSPPLDPRGETHSLSAVGVRGGGTNSDDGAYTLVLYVFYNLSTTDAMKYNPPTSAPHIAASLIFRQIIYRTTREKSQYGGVFCDSMIYREKTPRKFQFGKKFAKVYHCLYTVAQQSNCRWHCEPTCFFGLD
jgi:hypothetical protein